jgi:hypothetical protein
MAQDRPVGTTRAGTLCRNVAATLIAGVWRRHGVRDVRDRLAALPARDEAAVVGGVLLLLALLALAAAQFGPVGLLVYFLAVILVAN